MQPEQDVYSTFDRKIIPDGNYASDKFIDQYLPLEKETANLQQLWEKFYKHRTLDQPSNTNIQNEQLWVEFSGIAQRWLRTQIELGLNEFGVGKPRMMPSYYFVLRPNQGDSYKVAPLNTFEFVDLNQSFVGFDTTVGVGLQQIYNLAFEADYGTGIARVSSSELYQQFNSLTDVIEFYQVVDGDSQEKIVEGRYVLVGRRLANYERAFVHNYLAQRNSGFNQSQQILTESIMTNTGQELPVSAQILIQNPVKFDFGNTHESNISHIVEELNFAFETRFGSQLIEQSGVEMYQVISEKVDLLIDELFMAAFSGDKKTYRQIIGNLLTQLQIRWAEFNRPDISPQTHLYDVIWGRFPMVFAHATSGENLWQFGNPITNQWYFGDACGGGEFGQKWCKKCERSYTGKTCSKCDKSNQA